MNKQLTTNNLRPISYFFILLPLVLYGAVIGYLHRNLPAYDDYIVQLEIAQIINSGSVLDQIKILFSQLNEHRLAYTRFWFLINYLVGHNISYSALIFIGNMPLIGIWLVILWWIKEIGSSHWALLCIGWLLFQFQFFENSLWAMAALQNITIHLLYLLLFTLIAIRSAKAWRWAIVVGIVTCFTSGNGFLALGIGMLSLGYQRRWLHLAFWTALTATLSAFYFSGYQSVSNYSMLEGAPTPLMDKLLGVFAFLGQACAVHPLLSSGNFIIASGLVMSCLTAVVSLLAILKLWRAFTANKILGKDEYFLLVLLQAMIFIIASAVILSHTRIEAGNYFAAVSSRYQLYPTMLLICIFCTSLVLFKGKAKAIAMSALPVAILVWLLIFQWNLPGIYQFRSDMLVSFHNTMQLPHPDSVMISQVFTPNKKVRNELSAIGKAMQNPLREKQFILDVSEESINCKRCPNNASPDETAYIVLYHPSQQILYPIKRNVNGGFRSFWLKGKLFDKGFFSPINSFFHHASEQTYTYEVGILERKRKGMKFHLTGSELRF